MKTMIILGFVIASLEAKNDKCGKDNSPIDEVYEGDAKIETYPWLGYLFYASGDKQYTTIVVLITKEIVIASALEIDKLPKNDFRAVSRVVLGGNCSSRSLPVREYAYHPDFNQTQSTIALIQLDLDFPVDIRPICAPPSYFFKYEFYAMTVSEDCNKPQVKVYEMELVDISECKTYYRKSGLDFSSLWPTHTTCAKARFGGECLWQGGTVLALWQDGRWKLMGFGVYGPGCEAPARFLDYVEYQPWVRRSILSVGRPTISRIAGNEIVLRRTSSRLQRFGPCDPEETNHELHHDRTSITGWEDKVKRVKYNVTIYAAVEYSCVVFRAVNYMYNLTQPRLRLRRWCAGRSSICYDHQYIELDFRVEITFMGRMTYQFRAYGHPTRALDPMRSMEFMNSKITFTLPDYPTICGYLRERSYGWLRFHDQPQVDHFFWRVYDLELKCRNHWNIDCFRNHYFIYRHYIGEWGLYLRVYVSTDSDYY